MGGVPFLRRQMASLPHSTVISNAESWVFLEKKCPEVIDDSNLNGDSVNQLIYFFETGVKAVLSHPASSLIRPKVLKEKLGKGVILTHEWRKDYRQVLYLWSLSFHLDFGIYLLHT